MKNKYRDDCNKEIEKEHPSETEILHYKNKVQMTSALCSQ